MTASEFIAQHTGICYCEAVIAPDGSIEYAIPGHVYKLIDVARESRDELDRMMPMSGAIALADRTYRIWSCVVRSVHSAAPLYGRTDPSIAGAL